VSVTVLSLSSEKAAENSKMRWTKMRMMDVRDRILRVLNEKPGDTFSVPAIARAIGANQKATAAALGRLFKKGEVARPEKGVYATKEMPKEKKAAPEPEKPKNRVAAKAAKPSPAAAKPASEASPLSVISIDLLVEGERSEIDASVFLGKLLENRAILDARINKITPADQSKLKIRFSFKD
jgi:hypothetical protein